MTNTGELPSPPPDSASNDSQNLQQSHEKQVFGKPSKVADEELAQNRRGNRLQVINQNKEFT